VTLSEGYLKEMRAFNYTAQLQISVFSIPRAPILYVDIWLLGGLSQDSRLRVKDS
jgi:hypothetical protein